MTRSLSSPKIPGPFRHQSAPAGALILLTAPSDRDRKGPYSPSLPHHRAYGSVHGGSDSYALLLSDNLGIPIASKGSGANKISTCSGSARSFGDASSSDAIQPSPIYTTYYKSYLDGPTTIFTASLYSYSWQTI